jgi:hypothetical protein
MVSDQQIPIGMISVNDDGDGVWLDVVSPDVHAMFAHAMTEDGTDVKPVVVLRMGVNVFNVDDPMRFMVNICWHPSNMPGLIDVLSSVYADYLTSLEK